MGPQLSKNIANIVNQTSAEVLMQNLQTCMSQSSQSQNISGSFAFGISQSASMVINLNCVSNFQMNNNISMQIANAIQQKADSQSVALLDMLNRPKSENIATISNMISTRISSSMVQNTLASAAQTQNISANIAIGISQQLDSKTALDALAKMVATTGIATEIENNTSQKSSATSVNPLSFITDSIYAMLAVVFIIIIAIGGLLWLLLN